MQKKIIAILLPFLLGMSTASICFVLSGYGKTAENAEAANDTEICADNMEILRIVNESLAKHNVYAVNHPIETAYLEEQWTYPELGAAVATANFNFKYSKLWREEAETYANLIVDWLDDDPEMSASFAAYWEHENDGVAERFCYDLALYMRGWNSDWTSSAGIVSAILQLDMNRMNAIKLIYLYDWLREGSGWSWKYNWGQ
jgi:hypothetical protein